MNIEELIKKAEQFNIEQIIKYILLMVKFKIFQILKMKWKDSYVL